MTQEEKQLLLKDLCARLPCHPQIHICNDSWEGMMIGEFDNTLYSHHLDAFWCDRIEILPYLRPMSSMTEKEKGELKEYLDAEEVDCNGFGYIEGGTLEDYVSSIPYSLCNYVIDWLNEHHFDYRGLINLGLALEAPKGMYKI